MAIPRTEKPWYTFTTPDGGKYIITSKLEDRSAYFIYREAGGKTVKLGKGKDPKELEEKFTKNE